MQAEAVEEGRLIGERNAFCPQGNRIKRAEPAHDVGAHRIVGAREGPPSMKRLAGTMSELSSSIEQTSTAITQMSAAVRQIAENVEALSSAAEETAASAS